MFKTKRREVLSLHIFQKKCIGCEKCVDACRHDVLGMVYIENKTYATVEYPDRCVGCRRCEWACPADAVEIIVASK